MHYQLGLSWYLHQPESNQLSLTKVLELERLGPIDQTPGIPWSDKNGGEWSFQVKGVYRPF